MNRGNRKFINLRLPVLLACSLAVGILGSCLFVYFNISLFWIIAVIPVAAVIFILCAVFTKRNFWLIGIILCFLMVILGAVGCFTRLNNYSQHIIDGNTYTVSATVEEKVKTDGGEFIVLDKVFVNGRKVHGKIKAYLGSKYGEFCDVGYTISFESVISVNDLFQYGKINYNATENIRYTCNVFSGVKSEYGYSFFGSARTAIRKVLYDNLDNDTAAVTFAMLTGNTYGIEDDTLESFRYGGIAHIFAVSGLHIGIVFGIFSFLLRKLRLNKYVSASLCLLPVILYTGVCGFTLSSVRAAVMCAISIVGRLTNKKYDGLNSLSSAVIFILLFNPISLFSVGFQLSVCAVAGILLLSKRISSFFKKLPKKVTNAVAISLSAQAGTLPVMLINFGYLSGAGLLLNIILVPLLSVLFVLMFVSVALALIFPFSAGILLYAALPLEFIISLLISFGFEKALLSGFGAGMFVPVYFLGLFALSDKLNIKLIYRITAVSLSIVFLTAYTAIKTYYPFKGFKIIVSAYYGGGQVIIKSSEGNILIITENLNTSHTNITLNEYYANNLSAVIILGGENCVLSFDQSLSCEDIYIFYQYINLKPFSGTEIHYEDDFSVCGVNFDFYDGYNIVADCGEVKFGICASDYVPFDYCDILITDYIDNKCGYEYMISFNNCDLYDNVYEHGDFIFYTYENTIRRT